MNALKNPEHLIVELKPAIEALARMPVEMWHLWVIWILEKLCEYAGEEEYEEFLERVHMLLGYRVDHESW